MSLPDNLGTFGLGFKPIRDDVKRAKRSKKKAWSLPKPNPLVSRSFVKPRVVKCPVSAVLKLVVNVDEELIERFLSLFGKVKMMEVGEGSSKADVKFIGPKVKLNNWKATPLLTRKEFW